MSPQTEPVLLKYRFPKQYRHPTLSAQLTKTRITSEARALARCVRNGVRVPDVRFVDVDAGIIAMEWIDGRSIRALLGSEDDEEVTALDQRTLQDFGVAFGMPVLFVFFLERPLIFSQDTLMVMIGEALGGMHKADIIHSDLTTSNMMIHLPNETAELVTV